jgi:hypothetical protein
MGSIGLEHAPVVAAKRSVLVFLARDAIPATRRSMSVPIKQRNASSGVQTVGSLLTLKLVFTRAGHPVRALKAESSA